MCVCAPEEGHRKKSMEVLKNYFTECTIYFCAVSAFCVLNSRPPACPSVLATLIAYEHLKQLCYVAVSFCPAQFHITMTHLFVGKMPESTAFIISFVFDLPVREVFFFVCFKCEKLKL